MTSSVVKPVRMEHPSRVYQDFPDFHWPFSSVTNWTSVEKNIDDRNRSAFYHSGQWGKPSRLDTKEVFYATLDHLKLMAISTKGDSLFEGGESPRHLQAAAVMDRLARGLLWKISDCTFIPGPDVVGLADDYDALRAVLRVVRAGWATAAPDGLLVTDHGRDVASRMFVDR